ARHPVANVNAFNRLAWGRQNSAALHSSLEWTRVVPQVPGSYMAVRAINNAFIASITANVNPIDQIFDAAEILNRELTMKRREFGIID
ncbi:MAG: hypothetical protein FWC95_08000, partial [Defluviitaleaceae bacterium]|nr:hypothetical protein [Defluviitaleaceae bacterium]